MYESLILALFDRGTADLDPAAELAGDQSATESADPPEAARAPSGSSDPPFRARTWALERVRAGQAVLALDVRGTGALAPHPINPRPPEAHYGTFYKLLTDLLALGDSLAAMRIYDVLRAVALVRTDPKIALGDRPLRLFGAGRGAYLGYLAAALEPAIHQLELIQLPPSLAPILTNRLYPEQPVWVDLIPGQAIHADLPDLQPLVARREQRSGRS